MKTFFLSFIPFLLLSVQGEDAFFCKPAAPGEGRQVIPGYGVVEGLVKCKHRAFLGLPYAKPPTNQLRWRPPQPLDSPIGRVVSINATKFAPSCIQLRSEKLGDLGRMLVGLGSESEDCLYLNVFTPRLPKRKDQRQKSRQRLLPVLVFIHGGSFTTGGTAAQLYHPVDLLTNGLNNEAIVVTIDYRLGIFGFAVSNALYEHSTEPVGNYGILDQIAALQWVKSHIEYFDGDPDNITVMGHSAGSMSASYLQMIAPTIAHKWILLSGTAFSWSLRQPNGVTENKVWDLLAGGVGCHSDDVECVRFADASKLTAIGQTWKMDFLFGPTVDHRLITKQPDQLLSELDKSTLGPTLITVVKDEASLFIDGTLKTRADFERVLKTYFDDSLVQLVLERYSPTTHSSSVFKAANAAVTDAMFTCPGIWYYNQLERAFFAQFDHPMVIPSLASLFLEGRDYGVFHGSDLVLIFNFDAFITLPSSQQMKDMRNGIRRFMQTGSIFDPNQSITSSDVWSKGQLPLFRGQCQSVWSRLEGKPFLPSNYRSSIKL